MLTADRTSRATGAIPTAIVFALVFSLFLGLALGLQSLQNAFAADFSGYTDEPGHYLSSVMVATYIQKGFPGNPKRYADDYYAKYPRLGIGHWPPLPYFLTAGWILVFGPSRMSLMVWMAILAALFASDLFSAVRKTAGIAAGLLAGVLLLLTPLVRVELTKVMMDIMTGFFCLGATLALAGYLRDHRPRDAYVFGALSIAAIMSKPNALALALVPVFGLLLSGRWEALKRPHLWIAGIGVGLICGPWYVYTYEMMATGMPEVKASPWTIAFYYAETLWMQLGPFLSALTLGCVMFSAVLQFRKGAGLDPLFACSLGLPVSIIVFQTVVGNAMEDRYMIPAIPSVIFLLVLSAGTIADRFRFAESRWLVPGVLAIAAVILLASNFSLRKRINPGYDRAASRILALGDWDTMLVFSSGNNGESYLLSELAARRPDPSFQVIRAHRTFANDAWGQGRFSALVTSPAEVMQKLDTSGVDLFVVDTNLPDAQRLPAVPQVLSVFPQNWRLEFREPGPTGGIDVYRRLK